MDSGTTVTKRLESIQYNTRRTTVKKVTTLADGTEITEVNNGTSLGPASGSIAEEAERLLKRELKSGPTGFRSTLSTGSGSAGMGMGTGTGSGLSHGDRPGGLFSTTAIGGTRYSPLSGYGKSAAATATATGSGSRYGGSGTGPKSSEATKPLLTQRDLDRAATLRSDPSLFQKLTSGLGAPNLSEFKSSSPQPRTSTPMRGTSQGYGHGHGQGTSPTTVTTNLNRSQLPTSRSLFNPSVVAGTGPGSGPPGQRSVSALAAEPRYSSTAVGSSQPHNNSSSTGSAARSATSLQQPPTSAAASPPSHKSSSTTPTAATNRHRRNFSADLSRSTGGIADRERAGDRDRANDRLASTDRRHDDSRTSLIDDVRQACNDLSVKHSSARELAKLLANPHIDALLEVHENVSKQQKQDQSSATSKTAQQSSSMAGGVKSGSKPASKTGTGGGLLNFGIPPGIAPIDDLYEMSVIEGSDDEGRARSGPTRSNNRQRDIPDADMDQEDETSDETSTSLVEYPDASEIRVIGISKTEEEPLGVTVKENGAGHLEVARILADGLIDRQGLMRVGDLILEVNNNPVRTPDQLYDQLRRCKTQVTFKVVPSEKEPIAPPAACFMRALFDYDPSEDSLLPCKALGIAFQQGDIIEVLNQDDPNWWQARRVECPGSYTGLVPSQDLEERRRAFVLPEFDYATKTNMCGTRVSRKKETLFYELQANSEFDKAELALYEEVCRMPPFERKTLILVGAQGVGRRTLKNRLCTYDPDRFATALPHTSRPIREGELDGRQYHFVRQDIMNQDIDDNKYLEWGEYNDHMYGIKLDSIRQVIRSGKMCVIDCSPQCLKILKTPEFMPLIVFVGAPSIEQLRFMHEWGRNNDLGSVKNYTLDRAFGRQSRRARTLQSLHDFFEDEDLQGTVEESMRIQRSFEKYFDMIIINNNMEKTFEQLREALDSLSTEAQWVPISWIYQD